MKIKLVAATASLLAVAACALGVHLHASSLASSATEVVGMGCSDATVDGTPLTYQQEQEFIRKAAPVTIYRTPGMYWVVYPSTGGSDHTSTHPDASWQVDASTEARATCAVYLPATSSKK
jgi:hypothetical protein